MILKIHTGDVCKGNTSTTHANWRYITQFDDFEIDHSYVVSPRHTVEKNNPIELSSYEAMFTTLIFVDESGEDPKKGNIIDGTKGYWMPDLHVEGAIDSLAFDPFELFAEWDHKGGISERTCCDGKILRISNGNKYERIGMLGHQRAYLINDDGKTVETI